MIWKKLLSSYLIILSLLLILAGTSMYALNVLYGKTDIIVKEVIPLSEAVNKPDVSMINLQNSLMQFIMDQNESELDKWNQYKTQLNKDLQALVPFYKKYPKLEKTVKKQQRIAGKMIDFYERQIELVRKFDVVTAQMNIHKSNTMMEEYRTSKQETKALISDINLQSLKNAKDIKSQILIVTVIISLVALLIIAFIAYYMITSVSTPIRTVSAALGRISKGDLTVEEIETSRKDEVGDMLRSLNKMISDLRFTVSNVSDSALQVASQSEQLAASTEQGRRSAKISSEIASETVQGFEKQQNEIHKISVSIREMSSAIQKIAENSKDMIAVTETATRHTSEGSYAVRNVANQMAEISVSVDGTTDIIEELGTKSKEIDEIVRMITTLSEQTNLLALNAAIEAARAGKQGAGFTVVAAEVRKLAVESKKSASEISDMISDIQNKIEKAVQSMEVSKQKIAHGLEDTSGADKSLASIEHSINETFEKGNIVRTAILQVEKISGNIVNAVAQVQEIVHESTASLQNSSAASQEQLASIEEVSQSTMQLANLADQLQSIMENFVITSEQTQVDTNVESAVDIGLGLAFSEAAAGDEAEDNRDKHLLI